MRAAVYHEGHHLRRDELYDASAFCPVCYSPEPRRRVLHVQDDPAIDMLECSECGVASASMMPLPATLDRYYATYYDGRSERFTFDGAGRFAEHLTGSMAHLAHGARILDFGGGDGSLAAAIGARLGDASLEVVDVGRTLDGIAGRFDLVIASAVLEHIPEPAVTIRRLFGLLAPGGYFYARTPYVLPFARVLPRLDITFPAHVHDMGRPFWDRVPPLLGFDGQVVASRPSLVETTVRTDPLRTVAAHVLKAPGIRRLGFVGGWEVVLRAG